MRKSRLLILSVFLLFAKDILAQQNLDTLSWKSFVAIIKKNHPVSKQARLLTDLARARRLQALGGFDPKLEADFDRKVYDGTEYFSFLTPELKLPLWYGIELKGSYTEAEGTYLNPESKVPKEGLSFAGVNFQLGRGLLMDARRAAFRQAQIFQNSSRNEQLRILNDLFVDAGESFINWQNKYANSLIYEEALRLTKIRFEAVKEGFLGGDKPAIDTLEALTQIQQRAIALQQAQLDLLQAKYELSTFMWLDDGAAVDPDRLNILPASDMQLPVLPQADANNNPKLLSFDFKLQDLNVERRFKAEGLRPELSLGLGLLNQGRTPLRNLNTNYWEQNNKVNVRLAFPLTFAKARGDVAEAKIKIRQTEFDRDLMRNDIQNKIRANSAEQLALQNQLALLLQNVAASEQLLRGEEIKFRFGDSSLFLINSRETKLIEVREKLYAVQAKIRKAQLKSLWLDGSLVNVN